MDTAPVIEPQAFLRWVRPPQQARTRATLTRLLDAAEDLFAEKSFDEVGVADLTRRARTSVGGFYRRFRDKDGLLQAVHERFCDDARATADVALDPAQWSGASLAEIVEKVTAFLVEIYRDRKGLLRAFMLRGPADAIVRERTESVFQYIATRWRGLASERRAEIAHPAPEEAATFGLRVVVGTLDYWIQLDPPAPELDEQKLTRELTRVFTSYLGVSPHVSGPVHEGERRRP
jgi:AcrR family transcriptional regulator